MLCVRDYIHKQMEIGFFLLLLKCFKCFSLKCKLTLQSTLFVYFFYLNVGIVWAQSGETQWSTAVWRHRLAYIAGVWSQTTCDDKLYNRQKCRTAGQQSFCSAEDLNYHLSIKIKNFQIKLRLFPKILSEFRLKQNQNRFWFTEDSQCVCLLCLIKLSRLTLQ